VQGTEKVCLIQEQLSNNRIIVELDSKGQARHLTSHKPYTIHMKSRIDGG